MQVGKLNFGDTLMRKVQKACPPFSPSDHLSTNLKQIFTKINNVYNDEEDDEEGGVNDEEDDEH